MDRLWTPWRMQYIANDKGEGCIFCTALAQQNDRESLLLHRTRVLHDLEKCSEERYRKTLSDGLSYLEAQLSELGWQA